MGTERSDAVPDRRGPDRPTLGAILVVDDSNAIRRILRRTLEGAGYSVVEAGDGQGAIAACREVRPDLVLLDVDMPVMDGMATLKQMRADDALTSIPVLFLTARTGGADVALGLDLGAQDYLRKPCDPAELIARVGSALRLRKRADDLERRANDLDTLATRDPLTGVGNRRLLEARTADLAATAGADADVNLLLVDVDHFKRINDSEGHLVGDAVLRILAGRVGGAVPSRATVVRWGGEEFLVLDPVTTTPDLADAGERVRRAVCDAPISISPDRTLEVTISVGCARGPVGSFDRLLRVADEALYKAKREGRNRVEVGTSLSNR